MKYHDLRDFISQLEQTGKLKRIDMPISPNLEMTEIADRVLRAEGPALLFTQAVRADGSRYDFPYWLICLARQSVLLWVWALMKSRNCVKSAKH